MIFWRAGAMGAALVIVLSVAGCSSTGDQLNSSLDDSVAAVGSVSLAVELHSGGRALAPYADTVVSDALTQLLDAESSVSELQPNGAEKQKREDVLTAIRTAISATIEARESIASGSGFAAAVDALDGALHELKAQLQ